MCKTLYPYIIWDVVLYPFYIMILFGYVILYHLYYYNYYY